MSDGRIDGRFVVNTNLATSIRNELGISAEECKQMGSVWDAVVNEAPDVSEADDLFIDEAIDALLESLNDEE